MNLGLNLRGLDPRFRGGDVLTFASKGGPPAYVHSKWPPSRTRRRRIAGCGMAGLLLLLMAAVLVAPTPSSAAQIGIGVSIRIGPPPLPVYVQPVCPGPGYIWTPGYWAYDPVNGYYWVPGTWVLAPAVGLLWTPGYWGWLGGVFIWHAGYWGPHVGFYGGINYGFGYFGVGYAGGYWRGGTFFYNRAVNNVNVVNVTNVYNRPVMNGRGGARVSYNGGPGGIRARATPAEMAAEHDRHIGAARLQQQHQEFAQQNRAQFASVNHGKPNVVATSRPGEFQRSNARGAGGTQKFASHGPNLNGQHNASRAQGTKPQGGGNHPQTARAPSPRARPQNRTPSKQSPPARLQASRGTTPNHKTGGARGPNPSGGEPMRPSAPKERSFARPQGSTPSKPSPTPRLQASRGAMPNYRASRAHPTAQSHNPKPAEGGKQQEHEPEPRH
jgi:hypothetical protein